MRLDRHAERSVNRAQWRRGGLLVGAAICLLSPACRTVVPETRADPVPETAPEVSEVASEVFEIAPQIAVRKPDEPYGLAERGEPASQVKGLDHSEARVPLVVPPVVSGVASARIPEFCVPVGQGESFGCDSDSI